MNCYTILTRWYSGSSYAKETAGGVTKQYTFIGGDAYTAPVVAIKTGTGTPVYYYLLRDYLGSITHVVNTSKTSVAEYSYDAWGRMRNLTNWTNYAPGTEPALFVAGRGFTGHEHMPWFNSINMNGRIYDPLIGQFLSPDNYVQSPDFTQNFNRYSYCLNNPLKYSDPSGMRREALPNPADAGFPYNPEAAAWLANYYNRWDYNYGGIPGYGGGGGGGGVNTVTGFWDRNASTAGMLGFRYENGQYIDNATSNTVPYSVVYNNYITPHSSESYSFRYGNNIEWGYWAGVVSKPNMFLTLVLTDGTKLKFDFKNELRDISNTVNNPIRNYAVADITEQICAGALNFALGLFFGGIAQIGALGSSINSANSGASTFFEGARYSPKVLQQMIKADDLVHSFPTSVDGFATRFGQWSSKIGSDGRAYQWLEMGGSYGGKTGTFEFIKDASGVINHRFLNILKTPK